MSQKKHENTPHQATGLSVHTAGQSQEEHKRQTNISGEGKQENISFL